MRKGREKGEDMQKIVTGQIPTLCRHLRRGMNLEVYVYLLYDLLSLPMKNLRITEATIQPARVDALTEPHFKEREF